MAISMELGLVVSRVSASFTYVMLISDIIHDGLSSQDDHAQVLRQSLLPTINGATCTMPPYNIYIEVKDRGCIQPR